MDRIPIPQEPQPLLLTVEEAARMIRIGRSKMFGLIREGRIPSLRIGSARRIDIKDLGTFIDQQKMEEPPRNRIVVST